MFTANADSQYTYICLYVNSVSSGGVKFRNVICIDLTQMFGSGNEPTTVEEFERMYPQAYYPYSAPTLKPVQIAGIASTDAQGGELDAIEWTAQTLRAAGNVRDMLYSDHVDVKVGVYTFTGSESVYLENWRPVDGYYALSVAFANIPNFTIAHNNIRMAELDTVSYEAVFSGTVGISVAPPATPQFYGIFVRVPTSIASNTAQLLAWLAGKTLYYELATPTTTPISPALPMTYRVQQGGSESIIVPDGEVSAAPVLTVAEPVNMSTELTRIWEAIQSLGYTRNAAQLSRPVSLTDTVSVDETQKDTAEIAEIDTIKEVQE
ncbi:MAG: hypothetical protein IIX86_08795 [Clostridia bacterium]|nr:hypothetical protein [Clostridia bacterium]